MDEAKPFVKWAGGKRQLSGELTKDLPEFEDYHEPFIGGGALFFRLEAIKLIKKAYLNDSNGELINTYGVVKTNVESLIELLSSEEYKNAEVTLLNPLVLIYTECLYRGKENGSNFCGERG